VVGPNAVPVKVMVVAAVPVPIEDGEDDCSCGASITMLKLPVIDLGLLDWSMTCTMKLEVPKPPVGVPEITPDALMLRPAGSDPPTMEKVMVPVPPEAPIVAPA
jgi:hypothetical protein